MPFQKGQSGNPLGRRKKDWNLIELARAHTPEALTRLAHWMRSDDPKASIPASIYMVDRGYGKPAQAIGGTDVLPPIALQAIQRTIVDPKPPVIDVTPEPQKIGNKPESGLPRRSDKPKLA